MTSSIDNRGTKKEGRLRKRRNRYQKFQKESCRERGKATDSEKLCRSRQAE